MSRVKPKNNINKKKRARLDAAVNQGLQLERAGDLPRAVDAYRAVLEVDPDHPVACQALGNIYNRQGLHEVALPLLARAAAHFGDNAKLQCAYANCLRGSGREAESIKPYRRAARLDPSLHAAHLNLAGVLRGLQRMEEAIEAYTQALAAGANPGPVHAGLANCYRYVGKFELAIEHFEQALAENPQNCEALNQLAQLTDHRSNASRIAGMEQLAEETTGEDCALLSFALAKAYDDLDDSDSAFSWLERGNRLKRGSYEYTTKETAELFSSIRNNFQVKPLEEDVGNALPSPVFIVGMPRSGTSLVEQILASHSQVEGAGELESMNRIAASLEQQAQKPFPEAVMAASDEHLRAFAKSYLQEISGIGGGAAYVTDKMPQNFRYLGLIHNLFPRARIIHCTRDPIATCWSIYRLLFKGHHPYAYSQRELGEYYREYEELMAFWCKKFAAKIYTVSYENLVEAPETAIRQLLDWLELGFEQACLEFHFTERAVVTSSAIQVRNPIYRDAIEGWRQYEGHLRELHLSLQAAE